MFMLPRNTQEDIYQYPHGDEVYNVVSAFECKEYSGLFVHDPNEATMLQFFSLNDLPKNISPPDRPILEDYIIRNGKNPSND